MRSELGEAVDRRVAGLIVTRLRRSWPLLKVVPASWIVPIVAPRARRLRRSLSRGAVAVTVSAGAVIVLMIVRRSRALKVWPRIPADSTILIMRRQ
jgi:hypothetical protein